MSAQISLNSRRNGLFLGNRLSTVHSLIRPGRAFLFTYEKQNNLRSLAAQAVEQVANRDNHKYVFPPLQTKVADKDKSATQELCLASCELFHSWNGFRSMLMSRPMTGKQRTVHYLLMVGFISCCTPRVLPLRGAG